MCSAPYLRRGLEELTGELKRGPGGALYEFLQAHQDQSNPPVLIVNYERFDADDLVRFNGLLDKVRQADGTSLPEETMIIGLMNTNKPDCYQGSDFYSRFDQVETCPVPWEALSAHQQETASFEVTEASALGDKERVVIDLFHATDWEERLLGRWVIQEAGFYFVEGALQQAFQQGLPIELRNAPWEDEAFQLFWAKAMVRKTIDSGGQVIKGPDALTLVKSEGYDWAQLKQGIQWMAAPQATSQVLNPGGLSDFFTRYGLDDKSHLLSARPGWIEAQAEKTLFIHVPRAISEDEWALLLSACQRHQVTLGVSCAPSVVLPQVLSAPNLAPQAPAVMPWTGALQGATTVLTSSDFEVTLGVITEGDATWQVMDVSACEGDDLLLHTRCAINTEKATLWFEQKKQALLQALEKGQNVVLKGHFSLSLIDALAPFLLQRAQEKAPKGQLVMLSEAPLFNDWPAAHHAVSGPEKRAWLTARFGEQALNGLEDSTLKKSPCCEWAARLRYASMGLPEAMAEGPWQGLRGLPGQVQVAPFNPKNSAAVAAEFNQKRLDAVQQILASAPYVFLTGLTSVGKSTFVEQHFQNDQSTLYQGEAKITAWANDTSSVQKILFIDEANLSPRQWSEFEGLFNTPPAVLIDGVYYPLSPTHQVIFAGNPINYGDERQLAPFFARHGNALVFDPMPLEFIEEMILKPVFTDTPLAADALDLTRPFLDVYRFLCECSKDKVLISPRELQMMALLLLSYAKQHPKASSATYQEAARYYAHALGATLVPKTHQAAFTQAFAAEKPLSTPITNAPDALLHDFYVTPSRQPLKQQLEELLALRDLRQSATSSAQRYGGLGGLIIEGNPGVGKSELVVQVLRAQGYQEVHEYQTSTQSLPNKPFYRMPVSMQTDDKKTLLLKAFHEGAVVLVDEINSSPMMERLLNDLLMGKTPEGQRPHKPGFLIIGTQNPVTMAGRRAQSTALARRLITTVLPDYPTQEMVDILVNKGMNTQRANQLVNAYEQSVSIAQKEHLNPVPVFRDLIKRAEHLIKATPPTQPQQALIEPFLMQDTPQQETTPPEIKSILSLLAEANKRIEQEINRLTTKHNPTEPRIAPLKIIHEALGKEKIAYESLPIQALKQQKINTLQTIKNTLSNEQIAQLTFITQSPITRLLNQLLRCLITPFVNSPHQFFANRTENTLLTVQTLLQEAKPLQSKTNESKP